MNSREWFSRRGGAWSGTAGELLVSLRTSVEIDKASLSSLTSVELYAYLQSHQQRLRSLGMDVFLRNGVPRMVSLRPPQDEPKSTSPPVASDPERQSHPAVGPTSTIAPVIPHAQIASGVGGTALSTVSNSSYDAAIADPSGSESLRRDDVVKSNSSEKLSGWKARRRGWS